MTHPVYNFVVAIDFQVDEVTLDSRYVATTGFTTLPTDTPANTHIPARLASPGYFKQEIFSSARLTGAVRPSVGEIVIINNDGEYDDWIELGTAGGQVTVSMGEVGAAYPSGYSTVFIAYIANVLADFTEVRLRLRDKSFRLDKPVATETFQGTGDLEGPAGYSLKKPLVIGAPGYVPALLVDRVSRIYYLHANAVDDTVVAGISHYEVLEGGVQLLRGSNYASEHELRYTAPDEGGVRFYFGDTSGGHSLGPVWFRLGTEAENDIRVRVNGAVMDPDDSEHATAPGAWTMTSMCRRAGLHEVTPASMPAGLDADLDIAAQYITDDRSYLDVLQSAAFASQHFFGFNRLDEFTCDQLGLPSALESGESYVATYTLDRGSNVRRTYLADMEGPVWQVILNAGETWPSNLGTGVDDEVREALSRDPWQSSITATADAIRFAFQNAVVATLDTPARVDFSGTIARYFNLYGAHRDVVTFEVPLTATNLAVKLNDPIWIEMPRFGCDAGRHFRVCSLSLELAERRITIGAWGGPTASASYVLGGGTAYNGNYGGGIGGDVTSLAAQAPGATLEVDVSLIAGAASSPSRTGSASGVTKTITVSIIEGVATGGPTPIESLVIACGDETTAMTTGTAKVTFRMPYAFKLTAVKASVTTAPTGSTIIFDINEAGASILSTKLSIDASEKTSATAASAAVISDSSLAADAEMTIDFDQVGSTVAGAGPKITLIGVRA